MTQCDKYLMCIRWHMPQNCHRKCDWQFTP